MIQETKTGIDQEKHGLRDLEKRILIGQESGSGGPTNVGHLEN
jgi:hypothetical protein